MTGNQGYIGPVVTRMAQRRGHHVTGLDCGYFTECDVRDIVPADLAGIDAIIHLAGLSTDPMGALDPGLTDEINRDATIRLARLAKASGIGRFVFASSCSLYGAAGGDAALDETAPMAPVSAYAESKAGSETGLLALTDAEFSPVLMRNATAYGVGPRPRFDLVVNNLAGWVQATGALRVLSDGTPWRPLVHIEDIALAALCAAEAPRAAVHGQAFNIGQADCNYQVRDVAVAVGRAFPGATLEITGETGGDARSYRVSFAKALGGLPGFTPRWTLEAGVDEVARWIRDGGLAHDDFRSWRFVRLAALKRGLDAGTWDARLRVMARADAR